MGDIIVQAIVLAVVILLLLVLWSIIRFSFISPRRTRGAHARLRHPDLPAVERVSGFQLPPDLAEMYQYDRFVEESEFCLVDTSQTPPARWLVHGFIPLTRVDMQEWKAITGVPGVPIATDYEKGAYYVSKDGAVRLQSPNGPKGDILVAPTVAVFRKFTPTQNDSDEE